MRQAIVTKYHGPTNVKGTRVSARCDAKRRIYWWDHSLGTAENHQTAAMMLAQELGWSGMWCGGSLSTGGYVFVQNDGDGFAVAGV